MIIIIKTGSEKSSTKLIIKCSAVKASFNGKKKKPSTEAQLILESLSGKVENMSPENKNK